MTWPLLELVLLSMLPLHHQHHQLLRLLSWMITLAWLPSQMSLLAMDWLIVSARVHLIWADMDRWMILATAHTYYDYNLSLSLHTAATAKALPGFFNMNCYQCYLFFFHYIISFLFFPFKLGNLNHHLILWPECDGRQSSYDKHVPSTIPITGKNILALDGGTPKSTRVARVGGHCFHATWWVMISLTPQLVVNITCSNANPKLLCTVFAINQLRCLQEGWESNSLLSNSEFGFSANFYSKIFQKSVQQMWEFLKNPHGRTKVLQNFHPEREIA